MPPRDGAVLKTISQSKFLLYKSDDHTFHDPAAQNSISQDHSTTIFLKIHEGKPLTWKSGLIVCQLFATI